MSDFSDLRPIVTNTKKRGKQRTRRSASPISEDSSSNTLQKQPEDEDYELIIGSRKGDAEVKEKYKPEKRKLDKTAIYYHFEEVTEQENNDNDEPMTESQWTKFVGFLGVRIIVPSILLIHGIGILIYIYYYYGFIITEELQSQFPMLLGPLSLNLFLVHFLNKQIFKSTYYKLRNPTR